MLDCGVTLNNQSIFRVQLYTGLGSNKEVYIQGIKLTTVTIKTVTSS